MKHGRSGPVLTTAWGAAILLATLTSLNARPLGLAQVARVNRDARITADFENRVRHYVKIHRQAEAGLHLPPLKPTQAPEKIAAFEHSLAEAIRAARVKVRQGDIFTPAIATEFR